MNESVIKDARALSSGTIGSLINNTSYAEIDRVQFEFVKFCQEYDDQLGDWIHAWNLFRPKPELEKLPFGDDCIIFKSEPKKIGKTLWRILVFERIDQKDWSKPDFSECRYTRYQWHDGDRWNNETDHPRYDGNDGTFAGLPKGLRTLFYENKDQIDHYLHEEDTYPLVEGEGAPQYTFDIQSDQQLSLPL